ncbi:protein WHAT'S THIS FACTOR 1 homolog, chloroplastic [Impatiens glandulifera]|uniref:protein WHAT'S THIS FACTOR 1 homolog, chloroplastic n=1 Tax=Impatiens glandulifera TaxID=253017 RepID=UPI001FB0899F|nr:protein WHAT'S THIS FACTOR 1 homolog, chloroplastic [Impatiens glandulifera]
MAIQGIRSLFMLPNRNGASSTANLVLWFRSMTTSRRVQDRSKDKRIRELENATERWKIFSKVLLLIETLKQEPEHIIRVRSLEQWRRQINLKKPHKLSDFLRKSPKLFQLYKDRWGVLWCGLTKEGEALSMEEEKLIEEYEDKAAEYVTRILMMSIDKRVQINKIAHFRRDFGLPVDFRKTWVHKYPQYFKVVNNDDDIECLELVSWNPSWAMTELEKVTQNEQEVGVDHKPGLLTLPFPLKFPQDFKKVYRYRGKIEHFQKRPYLSPYADPKGLEPGSKEFDKRAVAVMHELLSFTIEKRLVTDHLTHFRRELVMPQKLMRLLLKHFGIFYVSERGKRFSVFLTEAYEGSEVIQKCPLLIWREKVQSLVGYRRKKHEHSTFDDLSDLSETDTDLFDDESRDGGGGMVADRHETEEEEVMSGFEDSNVSDGESSEMEIDEISRAY